MRANLGLVVMTVCWTLLRVGAAMPPDETTAAANRAAADSLFTNTTVLLLRLEVAEADLESLRKQPRTYVKATLREGEKVYTNIQVHLKGSAGSFRKLDDKPALTLRVKPAGSGETFHGLTKFHLNNSVQDDSYLNTWLCDELFREAEVPASRSSHALVELNGRKLGLYVLVESHDLDFLARYFKNTKGNLYGQSRNADITEPLERMEGKGENTRTDLKTLAEAARETDRAKLYERLPQVLDMDRFISFMAMEVMLCHWDGYTFITHNFRVYHDLDAGKMVFIPHDFDFMLGDANVPIHPGANGMVAKAILKMPETRARYRERFGTLFTNVFVVPKLTKRIDGWLEKCLPTISAYDANLGVHIEKKAGTVKGRIVARARALAEQINLPEPANLIIQGTVTDADTQKPIPQFMVVPGFDAGESAVSWDRTRVYRALRGAFDMDMSYARMAQLPRFLKFEADGYLPVVAKYSLSTNAQDAVYTVVMKKARRTAGVVLLPDGTPARGAQVSVLAETSSTVLGRGKFVNQPGQPILQTGETGRYSFSPDPEIHSVVAVHEKGFVEAPVDDLSERSRITLQPWGRIEGHMSGSVEGLPSAAAVLTTELLVPNLFQGMYAGVLRVDFNSYTAETPSNGPFVIEKVPPGERYIWRSVLIDDSTNAIVPDVSFIGRRLIVKPGETNRLSWGGPEERSIKGRIVLDQPREAAPANPEPLEDLVARAKFKMGFLKRLDTPSDTSPASEWAVTFGENDGFRINGDMPDRSQMELRVYAPPLMLGWARKEVVFTSATAGSNVVTADLGALELNPIKPAGIGDPAPLFELKDLDGTPLKLADFRGTNVLLHFWAAWSGPLLKVVPGLKAVCDQYRDDRRLAVIGLNLDRNPETAQRYAKRHAMTWRQAYLGEWFQTSLPAEYGVGGIPSAVLIGPDGKIVAKDMAFADLATVIKNTLKD